MLAKEAEREKEHHTESMLGITNGLTPRSVHSSKGTQICDGALHHVAMVYDAAEESARLYFDHRLIAEGLALEGEITGGNTILIGHAGWSRYMSWNGIVAAVKITGEALDPGGFLPPLEHAISDF